MENSSVPTFQAGIGMGERDEVASLHFHRAPVEVGAAAGDESGHASRPGFPAKLCVVQVPSMLSPGRSRWTRRRPQRCSAPNAPG